MEIQELQEKIKALKEMDERYKNKKKEAEELNGFCDALKVEIIEALESHEMTSFKVDKIANVSITHRMSVPTPKTVEDKKAFFQWVADNKGEEVRDAMMTVNSQTLNSFWKAEYESLDDDAKLMFQIDGLEMPSVSKVLSIRKA